MGDRPRGWRRPPTSGAGGRAGRKYEGALVIAVDPGREKSGIALVESGGQILARRVVATTRLLREMDDLSTGREDALSAIVLGDRTGSKAALRRLREAGWEERVPIVLVDEHRSSDEARERYWRDHPPRGMARMLPTSLRTPPEAYDDYVAVILAERYLATRTQGDDF